MIYSDTSKSEWLSYTVMTFLIKKLPLEILEEIQQRRIKEEDEAKRKLEETTRRDNTVGHSIKLNCDIV